MKRECKNCRYESQHRRMQPCVYCIDYSDWEGISVMDRVTRFFKDWTIFEKIWLAVFTFLVIGLSLYWQDTLMGVICSLTGIWCVVLVAKGRISNYWVGIVNVILYAIISYGYKYYGEVMLNVIYFLPMQFIGAYIWIKNKKPNSKDNVVIKALNNKYRLLWTVVSVLGVLSYGAFLKSIGGAMPYIDAMSTVLSVIAMLLMAFRFFEQWVLWVVVDVVTIVLWFVVMANGGNDVSILLMWIAYLVNAVYGLYNWIKMYNLQEV